MSHLLALASVILVHAAPADSAAQARLEELDQKVKVLERLRENDLDSATAAVKAQPRVQFGSSGLWIRTADSAYGIRFRGIVRNGANWDLDDKNDKTRDAFSNRTVRFGFDGVVGRTVEFKISSDWSKGSVGLQDAYLDLKLAPWANLRAGKFLVPEGLERGVSPSDLLFYDRALASQLVPDRDIGAQLFGSLLGSKVQYAIGVFDGGPDGLNTNAEPNDDKDVYARLWLQPLKGAGEWVDGLGIGAGANAGYRSNDVPSAYKTTSGSTFFSWNAADSLQGVAWRVVPQLQWTAGPFLAYGEWALSEQTIRRGAAVTTADSVGTGSDNRGRVYRYAKSTTTSVPAQRVAVQAWEATLSWVVSGEDANAAGVSPRHPFNLSKGDLGAFEVSARVAGLRVDDKAFANSATKANLADSTGAARSALAYGAALNWHLAKGTRLQLGWERTQFDDGAAVDPAAKVKVVRDRKSENQLFLVAGTSF